MPDYQEILNSIQENSVEKTKEIEDGFYPGEYLIFESNEVFNVHKSIVSNTNNDIVDDDREERDSNIINKLDELPIDDRNSETVELIDRIHEEVSWERQATATLNFLRQTFFTNFNKSI